MKKNEIEDAAEFDISEIPSLSSRNSKKTPASVPDAVLKRMPRYFRCLRDLFNRDVMRVSSEELAEHMGITASQLRQDMKYLGAAGQRGYGYNVKTLYTSVSSLIGRGKKYTAVIIGAGCLGTAIAKSLILEQRGVWLKGIFDISEDVCGKTIGDITVMNVSELGQFCEKTGIDIAVICYGAASSGEVIEMLKGTGIKGIWNFSPQEIKEKDASVPTENVCIGDSLMHLIYGMSCKGEQ